ncbi:hypothetical protein B0H14DRAFT_3465500 [Mycena olivaceomarginata]|nr:hypothetical protein B0H14DRAFT_3465500 [Mycena olivaceomarginata]
MTGTAASETDFRSVDELFGGITTVLPKDVVGADIQRYLKRSLDVTNPERWAAGDEAVEKLTKLADGLFVFAATAARYILHIPRHSNVSHERALAAILGGMAVEDLGGLYLAIVDLAILLPTDHPTQESYVSSRKILSTILELVEPLEL